MARKVNTVAELIAALGGATEVAAIFKVGRNAVYNWQSRGLPPETYVALQERLKRERVIAPDSLWLMRAVSE